jgi:hypothetical protein
VPGGLIAVNKTLVGHFVNLGCRITIVRGRDFCVTLLNRINDFLDCAAHAGLKRDIVLPSAFRLLGAFNCGFDIGHSKYPCRAGPVLFFCRTGRREPRILCVHSRPVNRGKKLGSQIGVNWCLTPILD